MIYRAFLVSCLLSLTSACSVAPPGTDIHDPFEAKNREVHEINKSINAAFSGVGGSGPGLDPELTQPVVNFADNAGLPGAVLNGLLQADIAGAATNTMRFVVNTTVGIGGLFDPAGAIGLREEETDFGETLAAWGAPEGAYLEVVGLGPTTERDLAGRVVDFIIDPLDRFGTSAQIDYGTGAKIIERLVKRNQLGDTIDSVLNDSADSYTQQRLIYMQNRRFELGTTQDAVDPYDDLFGESQ